jgi:hypothetical protein
MMPRKFFTTLLMGWLFLNGLNVTRAAEPAADPFKQIFDVAYDESRARGLSELSAMTNAMRIAMRLSGLVPAPASAGKAQATPAPVATPGAVAAPSVVDSEVQELKKKHSLAVAGVTNVPPSAGTTNASGTQTNGEIQTVEPYPLAELTSATAGNAVATMLNEIRYGKSGTGSVYQFIVDVANSNNPSYPARTKGLVDKLNAATNAYLALHHANSAKIAVMFTNVMPYTNYENGSNIVRQLTNTMVVYTNLANTVARMFTNVVPYTNFENGSNLVKHLTNTVVAYTNLANTGALAEHFTNAVEKLTWALELELTPPEFTPKAFLHVGYVTLNPYKFLNDYELIKRRQRLEEDNDSSAAYIEFQYNNHWAWNESEEPPKKLHAINWVNPFYKSSNLDLTLRFGYSFINSESEDSVETSSIVGGGNISAEFVLGRPFIKYQNDWVRSSVNAETSLGMTSDRSVFDIHSTWMTGIGYYASVQTPLFPGKVMISSHLGIGFVEVPRLTDGSYMDEENFVFVDAAYAKLEHGRPDFKKDWGAVGMSLEVMLPLTRSIYVMGGGRLYANANPNPWTAYIGISKDLGSFRKILLDDDDGKKK